MTIYTTPLQFGYFFSIVMCLLFLYRGYKERRLSDKMIGWVMLLLALELQDYTFGFAGINFLWNEMNGFPRGVTLLFGPVAYLYFRSQINRGFRMDKKVLIHFVPYALYFLYHIVFFVQGPETVQWLQQSTLNNVLFYVLTVLEWVSYLYYFSACLRIYHRYKKWSLNQFSNEDLIGFNWFRNFIIAMLIWLIARQILNVLDIAFDLSFYQDWWWNLVLVVVAFYIGLAGYAQPQPAQINFESEDSTPEHTSDEKPNLEVNDKREKTQKLADKLSKVMESDRLYLNQELNLRDLAKRLKSNSVELSAAINQHFKKNFNDYINDLRIEEFVRLSQEPKRQHYTLLSNAYDAGFSSKSTFNRAFRKSKGIAPGEYLKQAK